MAISDIPISLEDFLSFDWQHLIADCEEKTCEKYRQVLSDAIGTTDAPNQKNVLMILQAVSMLLLVPDSEPPFKRFFEFGEIRAPAIDDFSEEQLKVLGSFASNINDPELRARVADAVWIRLRDFQLAQIAVRAYLCSADTLDCREYEYICLQRVERAVGLAASLGKGDLFDEAIGSVDARIARHADQNDSAFAYSVLMAILIRYERGDFAKHSALSSKLALELEKNRVWLFARRYWELVEQWESLAKNKENSRKAKLCVVETYVQEAQDAIERRSPPSYMVAAELLRHAIEALRRASETKPRQDELHKLLLEYQKKSLEEFGRISSEPVDLTKIAKQAIDLVSGKSLNDAILSLAVCRREKPLCT